MIIPIHQKYLMLFSSILLIFLVGCGQVAEQATSTTPTTDSATFVDGNEIKTTAKGEKYIILPDKLIGGGPPKDGIPSLDHPRYVSVEEANAWIQDNALVLAINYKDVKRVYPLQIMTWHEIVNDVIADDPILITYCPLCGSGIAYERTIEVDGKRQVVEFGTSGKLYNSNLVMYDRETDSSWTQIGGQAIIGPLSGQKLIPVSLETVEWATWKAEHPNSEVLSIQTGFSRDYTNDKGPYSNYFANDFLFYAPLENEDESRKLANKEFIYGIEINGEYKAYAKKDVETLKTIEDTFNSVNLKIEQKDDGSVQITNVDSGEEIIKEVDFWFAWFAFHPTTLLYGAS